MPTLNDDHEPRWGLPDPNVIRAQMEQVWAAHEARRMAFAPVAQAHLAIAERIVSGHIERRASVELDEAA